MTYINQAVILAGGKGERLSETAGDVPKALVKIGDKPILEHHVIQLRRYGIADIVLCVKHLSEKIVQYFRDGSKFGVRITYSKEKDFLGTAGAVKFAEDKLGERFLVVYGDVMFSLNIRKLMDFHRRKNALATLVVHESDHPHDSTIVTLSRDSRITGFFNPPHQQIHGNLTSAAFYVFERSLLKNIPEKRPYGFSKDFFPKLIGKRIYGYMTDEYLKDMGTPERLEKVNKHYKEGRIFPHKTAVFLDRDGVINKEVDLLTRAEQIKLIDGSAEAIKMLNKNNFWVIVVTNQPVVARNLCTEEDIDNIHKKLKAMLEKKGACIDAIYYCPHHPERGHPEADSPKYRRECDCRKPKIGMLKRASEEFHFNLKESIIIGDRTVDIKTGKNAGCKTILVKTGYGGSDSKYEVKPDHVFENLLKASNFIIRKFKGRV
jgi:histidinol-phosphate phosphatase family protein